MTLVVTALLRAVHGRLNWSRASDIHELSFDSMLYRVNPISSSSINFTCAMAR